MLAPISGPIESRKCLLAMYSRFLLTPPCLHVAALNLSDQDPIPAIRPKIPANAESA